MAIFNSYLYLYQRVLPMITQGIPRVMEQLQVDVGAQQCSSVREDPEFVDNSTSYHCYHDDFPKSHLPKSSQFGFPSLHSIYIYMYCTILYICLKKKTTNMCTKPGVSITTKGTLVADSVKAASTRCFWCLGRDFCSPVILILGIWWG